MEERTIKECEYLEMCKDIKNSVWQVTKEMPLGFSFFKKKENEEEYKSCPISIKECDSYKFFKKNKQKK